MMADMSQTLKRESQNDECFTGSILTLLQTLYPHFVHLVLIPAFLIVFPFFKRMSIKQSFCEKSKIVYAHDKDRMTVK